MFIVATYPYNFSWTYSKETTDTNLYNFSYENSILSSFDKKQFLKIINNNIIFTTNKDEASKIYLEKTNVETNYRIKYQNKYIRHKDFKLCYEEDDFTELFKSDSTWIFIENKINLDHTFVIARYKENINWTRYLPGKVIIYNKGPELILPENRGNIQIVNSENVGREAHTYLYHIIQNYDNLSERVTFLQGDPFDHSPYLIELCCMEKYYSPIQSLSCWYLNNKTLKIPNIETIFKNIEYLNGANFAYYKIRKNGDTIGYENDQGFIDLRKKYILNMKCNENIIDNFLTRINMEEKIKDEYLLIYSALFSVKKENILKHDLQKYKNMVLELLKFDTQGNPEAWVIERCWYEIFL
jgi:hypothetical protein